MTQALGQLPKAPLIYVLAQVVFTRVPKMDDIWEDFHKSVFNVYPESEIEHIEQFALKKEGLESSKETRWHLLSRDKREGLILHSNQLILHTTRYTTSQEFFATLELALANLIENLPGNISVSRMGLRYIDFLIPHGNLTVDSQVDKHLGMLDLDEIECKTIRFERIANYHTKIGGELIIRHRQTTAMDVLPNDLFPNILEPAPLLNVQKQHPDDVVGMLDFDHVLKTNINLDTTQIIDTFEKLQKITSAAFRQTTTKAALDHWSEES